MKNLLMSSAFLFGAFLFIPATAVQAGPFQDCVSSGESHATCACERALRVGTRSALNQFMRNYDERGTACEATASTSTNARHQIVVPEGELGSGQYDTSATQWTFDFGVSAPIINQVIYALDVGGRSAFDLSPSDSFAAIRLSCSRLQVADWQVLACDSKIHRDQLRGEAAVAVDPRGDPPWILAPDKIMRNKCGALVSGHRRMEAEIRCGRHAELARGQRQIKRAS